MNTGSLWWRQGLILHLRQQGEGADLLRLEFFLTHSPLFPLLRLWMLLWRPQPSSSVPEPHCAPVPTLTCLQLENEPEQDGTP